MEHYEMLQDSKYRHYHQRLQNLLKQSILKQPRPEQKISHRKTNSSLPLIRESEEVWKTHEHCSANSGHMVAENLQRQENSLQGKIRARRSRYTRRLDHKAASQARQERMTRIAEVYAKQVEEIQRISMNEELLKRLVGEIHKKKQEELAAVAAEFDAAFTCS